MLSRTQRSKIVLQPNVSKETRAAETRTLWRSMAVNSLTQRFFSCVYNNHNVVSLPEYSQTRSGVLV